MDEKNSKIAVIIPAYNEEKVIKDELEKATKLFDYVICVDDGSEDATHLKAKETHAICLSHMTNIGQGGGLETGIKFALKNPDIEYFATFDGDGQHELEDVMSMIEEIKNSKVDIVIGSRFIEKRSEIPKLKKTILLLARVFTNLTTGLRLTDTHNGLRVFNKKFAEKVELTNFGMAHASEFLEIIKVNNFTYREFPVNIKYSDYSKKKGQPIINVVNIVFDLLFH